MKKSSLSQDELFRYSRHLMIPEIGLEGQKRLKSTSVLIIGAGGLGSPVSLYLAAAGIGRLGIVDDDAVEPSNLQRQIVHGSAKLGIPKVLSAQERLTDLNPFIQVETFLDCFNHKTAFDIADGYDILVDCTDNFSTRYLINDLCALTQRPDVYGAVYRFEGQVSVFDARYGPCYRCLFPEPPSEDISPSCGDSGVLGVIPGIIGTLQAAEVIKLALGIGESLIGKLLVVDALSMEFRTIRLSKRPDCALTGEQPQITQLLDYDHFCGIDETALEPSEMISAKELAESLKLPNPPLLLDVREPIEAQVSALKGALSMPLERLSEHLSELDRERTIVVFCRTGKRSKRALRRLKKSGFTHVKDLTGGINAWVEQVEPEMNQY